MSYHIEITCDVQRGNTIAKKVCESRQGARGQKPTGSGPTSKEAIASADRAAEGLGWKKVRRPLRNPATGWACPACQDDGAPSR